MTRYRSWLSLVVAAIAVLVVGCSSAKEAAPPTYSPVQVEQIQAYSPRVVALRERIPELKAYIQAQDWVNVQSFVHGPLGELRSRLSRLSRQLLPQDQAKANDLAKDLYNHLVAIDEAAVARNTSIAKRQYQEALADFDAFLDLLPQP
ncbi:MAG: photosystem II protein PsbQ [Leptolyngbyaceae cyanobacterium SM1_1_3]|nr:photosystem II protein PsbQ [Leptolyngbyaceae cyanobacterium SM1_1_3]NJN01717.1 photosystem II protein PsbQ [Leptolyngbyaceae cyanobacterium RM1_1_2]NJO09377.1 photosystem II protein PsbQ [Leptolyngbyaceae cyanobacterium SL_1_1]